MLKKITVAVDAMGGDNSPLKVINGINHHFQTNKNIFYKIFGNNEEIKKILPTTLPETCFEIIHTNEKVKGTDSPLSAARGKDTSMWLAIKSVKDKEPDIVISAGNTGALLVMSRLILKTIDAINKPAQAGLWPNNNNMNLVMNHINKLEVKLNEQNKIIKQYMENKELNTDALASDLDSYLKDIDDIMEFQIGNSNDFEKLKNE